MVISIGALSFVWNSFRDDVCTTSGRGDPHMPILQIIGGKQASTLDEAIAITGHDIKIPKYLPPEYKIRKISISDNRIVVLTSKHPVTNSTINDDYFYQDRGITIYYDNMTEEDRLNFIKSYSEITQANWKKFDINGMPALGYEIDRTLNTPICFPAQIQFYLNHTSIIITGMAPTGELIKIASSID